MAPGPTHASSDAFIKVSKPELIIIKRPTNQTVRPSGRRGSPTGIRSEGTGVLANVKVVDENAPDCGLNPSVPINLAPEEQSRIHLSA
ncbi:MAG: hypothetical protein R3C44_07730 [Chloroflexota bacterium]